MHVCRTELLAWKEKLRWPQVKVAAHDSASSANLNYRYRGRRHKFSSLLFLVALFYVNHFSFTLALHIVYHFSTVLSIELHD
jgi:hypothetical protein